MVLSKVKWKLTTMKLDAHQRLVEIKYFVSVRLGGWINVLNYLFHALIIWFQILEPRDAEGW